MVRRIRCRADGKTDCYCPYTFTRKARWCYGPKCPEWEDQGEMFRIAPYLRMAGYIVLPVAGITLLWSLLNYMFHHLVVSLGIILLGIALVLFSSPGRSKPERYGICRKILREEGEAEDRGGYLTR